MRLSFIGRSVLVGCFLTFCSCSRTDSADVVRLKADLEAARAEAAAAQTEVARLKSESNAAAPRDRANHGDTPASSTNKGANHAGAGELRFADGKTRRFSAITGVKGTQSSDLSFKYEKLPGEVFFSTVDRGELFMPIKKLARIKISETDNSSNPEAEVVPIAGEKLNFRYWILSSLVDVEWEGSIATERMHLGGDFTITFDQ